MEISSLAAGFPLIMLACFGMMVLLIVFSFVQTRQKIAATKAWPYTEGRIMQCLVERRTHTESYQNGNTRSTRTVYRYHPRVTYEYRVNGQTYVGKRIRYGGFEDLGYISQGSAQEEAGRYAEGSTQPVYYNPANPAESVLSQGQ